MKHKFHIIYTPIEDGWIMAQAPELPGAVTQGENMEEARTMIKDSLSFSLKAIGKMPFEKPLATPSGRRFSWKQQVSEPSSVLSVPSVLQLPSHLPPPLFPTSCLRVFVVNRKRGSDRSPPLQLFSPIALG